MMRTTPNWRWKPLVLAVAIAVAPDRVLAQVAAAAGGPAVGAALNGVPLVNIVAPNGAGVSHNRYNQFNVDSRGLILNNATVTTVTQLGGAVQANTNLGNTPARLILNEVVQANPSLLAGFIEVAGTPASVVLANAAGITCNGCGFVNTPRVTLTTGAPNFDATGNLTGFAITSGNITITGNGLNGTGQTYFDILARAVNLAGSVNAKDLAVAAGSNNFDYVNRSAAPIAGSGVPYVAIDSTSVGGMYADRIRLIVTENGAGVHLLGNVGAGAGDISLTAAGKIELLGRATASNGNIAITYTGAAAADAISTGSATVIAAGQDLTVNGGAGGATLAGGTIGATRDASFQLASLTDSGAATDLRYAGRQMTLAVGGAATVSGPNWNGGGGLNVSAGSLTVGAGGAGFFSATGGNPSGAVAIHTVGNLALGTGSVSGTTATLTTDGGTLSIGEGGAVEASGAVNLGVGSGFTNAGSVSAGGDLNFSTALAGGPLTLTNAINSTTGGRLEAGGAVNMSFAAPLAVTFNNQSGATLIGDTVNLNVAAVDNAGKLQGTHGSTITAGSYTNEATGLTVLSGAVGSTGTLTANTITNLGNTINGGVATAGITASGGMTLNVRDTLANSGNLVAAQDLTVSGGDPAVTLAVNNATASSLIQAGGTLTLQGNGGGTGMSLTNAAGATILGGNRLVVRANGATNSGNLQGTFGSDLVVAGTFTNQGNGIVTLAQDGGSSGSLTADGIFNNASTSLIQSFGGMTLNARDTLTNSGTIASNGDMTLHATAATPLALTNNAKIQAGGVLTVNGNAPGTTNVALTNSGASSLISGSTVNLAVGNLNNGGQLYSGHDMTATASQITNSGTAAIYAHGNLSLTAGGGITNQPGGVILSDGTMTLASGGAILNDMVYGSGSSADQIGTILSGGALTINATGVLTNHGYIDSNSGNVNIAAQRVDNISFAPSFHFTLPSVQLLGDVTPVGSDNVDAGTVFPMQSGRARASAGASAYDVVYYNVQTRDHSSYPNLPTYFNVPGDSGVYSLYFLYQSDKSTPLQGPNYIYRDFNAKAYSGIFAYDRPVVQARIVAQNGNMTVTAPSVNLTGSILSAAGNMTINGNVDLTPIALAGQTVWNVAGQDRFICTLGCGGMNGYDAAAQDTLSLALSDYTLDAAYRIQGLNDPSLYTLTSIGTGSLVTMSATLQSSGGQRLNNSPPVNPGGMVINGSVTTHNPADLIPGLSSINLSSIAPTPPVIQSPSTGGAAGGVQPAASLIAAGVNLTLPSNPNGLFIQNPDPNAKYLIETNPKYTTLDNILFGSDYLVKRLGLDPDDVMQRLGDANYEAQLITQQIERQTGRALLAGAANINSELQALLDNSAWEAKDLKLTLGTALTANQLNSLKQDMVWMVATVVDGHTVLAPVVYLSSATRGRVVGGTQIVADSLAVSGSNFINNGGTVDVSGSLSIHTTGNIVNTAGTISGGNVSLVSDSGNISNRAVVSRLGDSDNYRDVIDRGNIVSTGTLNISATQGNVTNSGSQLRSGGDASIAAGGNVNFEAVVLENKTTTTSSQSGWLGINSSTTTVTTTTQRAVGGDLSAGDNLTVSAGQNLNLTGSQIKATGDLTVDAQNVNIANATTTDTRNTQTKSSGLSISLTGGGSNANLSMGYGTSNSNTTQTDTNVVASGLSGGGNTRITGRDSVTVTGSDINSGGDLTVDTGRLTTQAAQQTTTINSTSSSTNVGVYGSGSGDSASAGWQGSHNDSNSQSSSSTARVSTLNSGGNMTLGNAAGDGTIAHQGTQITAGGNFAQSGSSISFTAAQNQYQGSNSSTTSGGQTGISVVYNGQQTYDQAKGGGVPDAAAPSIQGSIGGSYSTSNGSASGSQAVAGSIRAGGNISSTSSGNTTFEGTAIQAGGDVKLSAGTLDYKAATSTSQSSNSGMTTGGSAYLGEDATGSVVGGASGNYGTTNSGASATAQQAGSIRAGGNTTITTTGDAAFQGTNINTAGNTTITAGGKVDYQAATDTSSSNSSSQNIGGGVDASKTGKGKDSTKSGTMSGNYDNSNDSQSSTTQRGGAIASGGNVTITAGSGSDLTMVGTDIAAGGNVGLSGRNVNLQAAQSTTTTGSSSFSAGGSAGKESSTRSKENPEGDKGGSEVNVNMNSSGSSGSTSSQQGAVITGRNINISAGNDVSMQGTVVAAQDKAGVNAGGKLTMQSAQDTSSNSGGSTGFSVGRTSGEGSGGHVGGSTASDKADNVVNRNAIISGNDVTVTTGGDVKMSGANIAGNTVTANIGGNLSIESRNDVSNSSNFKLGGYVGGANETSGDLSGNSIVSQRGELAKTGIGFNAGSGNTSSSAVNIQSGISGQQSNAVTVTGSTSLTGAAIGGAQGSTVSLSTTQLNQTGMAQSSSASGGGFGFSLQAGNLHAPNTSPTVGGDPTSSTLQSSVQGSVTQTGPGAQPVTASAPGMQADGRTPMQPTVNLAQLGSVLNQPQVQTAMLLNRGMKTAVAQYGSSDNVPGSVMRQILTDAGVTVSPNAGSAELARTFQGAIDAGKTAATQQLSGNNVPAAQVDGVLQAMSFK